MSQGDSMIQFSKQRLFCVLYAASLIGICIFTSGFLIVRKAVSRKSECNDPPMASQSKSNGCWLQMPSPNRPKIIMIVIDALRIDMALPNAQDASIYRNKLNVLYDLYSKYPNNTVMYQFIADPPTATTQRLQGLTAGTLPTFIEIGANFAEMSSPLDNWLWQMLENGYENVHFYGDDTWTHLFPYLKDRSRGQIAAYLSFQLFDLHTVDNAIKQRLYPLMQENARNEAINGSSSYDVAIAHFLGLDHCGHKYGPLHEQCALKLTEMNNVINMIVNEGMKGEDDLLIVFGDHGMTDEGDHGGVSPKELSSVFFAHSKHKVHSIGSLQSSLHLANERYLNEQADLKFHSGPQVPFMNQVDLVPSLSVLCGLPIPFSNLGIINPELFFSHSSLPQSYFIEALRMNIFQVKRYLLEGIGVIAKGFTTQEMSRFWSRLDTLEQSAEKDFIEYYHLLQDIQRHCKHVWASFSDKKMIFGIFLSIVSILGTINDNRVLAAISIIHALMMTATSFVVFEDDLMRFALNSVILFSLPSYSHAIMSMSFIRMTKWIGGCREEQFPYCQTVNHRSIPVNLQSLFWVFVIAGVSLYIFRKYACRDIMCLLSATLLHAWWIGWWLTDNYNINHSYQTALSLWTPRAIVVLLMVSVVEKDGKSVSINALLILLSLLSRPLNGFVLFQSIHIIDMLMACKWPALALTLYGQLMFFVTGHQYTISSIQWETGFIGWTRMDQPVQVALIFLNTFSGPLLAALALKRRSLEKNDKSALHGMIKYQLVVLVGTAISCKLLMRHLMVWKIFTPRFLFQLAQTAAVYPLINAA